MTLWIFPARFTAAPEGGYVVTFRDIPEAITQGDTDEEAMDMAQDVLASALEAYREDRRAIPEPSAPQPGERLIRPAP